MIEANDWKHVFKLDPDKSLSDQDLYKICTSGTDGIIVGGTYGVTYYNTLNLLSRIRKFELPCVLEVSNQEAIVPGFDHYFIPLVLNATDPEWIVKPHHQALKKFGTMVPWQDITMVGYCVLNPKSAVARLTKSKTDLHIQDIIAYGRMTKRLFHFPYFYIEYSGSYGDVEILSDVHTILKKEEGIHMFYGGGIRGAKQSLEISACADTLVVGNVIYENIEAALETVPGC